MNIDWLTGKRHRRWVFAALLAGLAGMLFVVARGFHEQNHQDVEIGVRELLALDTRLNLDILKLRQRQQLDYDSLAQASQQIERLLSSLEQSYAALGITSSWDAARKSWREKSEQLEQFERLNAVLGTSSYHFVNLSNVLGTPGQHTPTPNPHLDQTVRDVLVFMNGSAPDDIQALRAELAQVEVELPTWPAPDRLMGMMLIAHGNKIVEEQGKVRRLVDSLIANPFAHDVESAYLDYNRYKINVADRTQAFGIALAILSLLLFALVAGGIIRQRRTRRELALSHRMLDNVANNLGEGILSFDADGRLNFLNRRAEHLLGRKAEELLGLDPASVLFSDARTSHESPLLQAFRSRVAFSGEAWICGQDGKRFPAAFLGAPSTTDAAGNARSGYVASFRDLSEIHEAQARLHLAARVFDNLSEAMILTDSEGRTQYVNAAFLSATGYTESEALDRQPHDIIGSGQYEPAFMKSMLSSLRESGKWRGEIVNRRKDGTTFPAWLSITGVKDASGQTVQYIGLFSDITERKEAEDYIHYLAYHDPLTGLANRTLFNDRLNNTLRQAHRNQRQMAVMLLDLDRFKSINDTLGHSAGDQLLQEVARRLQATIREEDTLARLGGDEFALLMPEIHSSSDAAAVATKLLAQFGQVINLETQEVFAGTSIGIALYPDDGDCAETLLKHADTALYAAKDAGRSTYRFFELVEGQANSRLLEMESALRQALGRGQFRLHYQLQLDLKQQKIAGVEALVRWQHPEFGLLLPERFIPMAETLGQIDAIGSWVLENACRQWIEWSRAGCDIPRVAVNVSVRQLRQPDFVDHFLAILDATGCPATALELELTESTLCEDPERTFSILTKLRQRGIRVALDDFGTGYSSLSYLSRYPVDVVKIDRSFIAGLEDDPGARSVVQAIILLSHGLQMSTVAEGVETQGQQEHLAALGCDCIQGFLFARPCPPETLPSLIDQMDNRS